MRGSKFKGILFKCFSVATLLTLLTSSTQCEASGGSNQTLVYLDEPQNMETLPNQFVMMECSLNHLPPNHHLVWTRNGKPIMEDSEQIHDDVSPRFRGLGFGPRSNLGIDLVEPEDHGSYFSCQVYNNSLKAGGKATLIMESRTAVVSVSYPPSSKYPQCLVNPQEGPAGVSVILSCCTEIVSVPMSLAWVAQGENSSWRITQQASKWDDEVRENCIDVDIGAGLNFSLYQCKLNDASEKLEDFETRQCKIAKLPQASISLKYLNHRNAQFNCSVQTPGNYQYLWHLQDEEMKQIRQVSSLSTQSSLHLPLSQVTNGSFLSCSIFDGSQMGATDLKIVLSATPTGGGTSSIVIIGIVIGAVVGVLLIGLSTYFLVIKCRRRNERLYASLERGPESGMHVGAGSTYVFHKGGANGHLNGTVVTAEGGRLETGAEEIPPKPGGHRTISWEPEDIIIRSNGGVINTCDDPKKRNVEGLVYADLAFQGVEEEPDAELEGEAGQEDAVKGAVGGGDANGVKPGGNDQSSIEYARIVPPPRSLRF
ncbi:uncharacterized protein [Diadema setosum]|uniref:uncharacterized protein n=1 Tax=Diadema setosum TaxID=31175 RepID=UPI003B3A48D4